MRRPPVTGARLATRPLPADRETGPPVGPGHGYLSPRQERLRLRGRLWPGRWLRRRAGPYGSASDGSDWTTDGNGYGGNGGNGYGGNGGGNGYAGNGE